MSFARIFPALALLPLRMTVDAVLLPKHLAEGDDLLPHTTAGINKVERELDRDLTED